MTLSLPLGDRQTLFSLRAHVPVGVVLDQIACESDRVRDAALYEVEDDGRLGPRWSRAAVIEDVLREAARGPRKGFVVAVNGASRRVFVPLPPFAVRAKPVTDELARLEEEFAALRKLKDECDRVAERSTSRRSYLGLAFLVGQWAVLARLTYWEFSWDVMEPICYFITSGNAIVGYIFYLFFKKEFTYENLHNINFTKRQMLLYNRQALDVERYYELKGKVERAKEKLQKIKSEYD